MTGNHATHDGGGIEVNHASCISSTGARSITTRRMGTAAACTAAIARGVTLNGDASIHHNTAGVAGGGLGSGGMSVPLHMRDRSSIHDNTAPIGGGVWLQKACSLDMSGTSSISGNTASVAGGGAYLSMHASLAVGATATVSGNVPDNCYSDSPPGVVACTP